MLTFDRKSGAHPTKQVRGVASAVACMAFTLVLAGCGGGVEPPTTARVNASGKVTFDGKPVPAGTVTFLHNETGHMAVCPINDGAYENESGQGPNPGQNTVTIVGMDAEGGTEMWSGAWTKTVQVGEGDFTEDYAITSAEVKPYDPQSRPVDD